ncbi:MAG TPA: hypothetical protein VFQ45_19645 [Longimicrobium sp.]|nr:hypothetical protein [Longimicrobium sp.]
MSKRREPPGTEPPHDLVIKEAALHRYTATRNADSLLLHAFMRRYSGVLERVAGAATDQALADALAARDDVGGLAELLARVAPLDPPSPDPLGRARARGARGKTELLARAGGALRLAQAARRLGVTAQAVHARRKRGTLLAVPHSNGEFLYPACQFTPDGGALPGLAAVLQAFAVRSPWTQLSVLLAPHGALGGRTPLEALAQGQAEQVVAAVRTYGEHGA